LNPQGVDLTPRIAHALAEHLFSRLAVAVTSNFIIAAAMVGLFWSTHPPGLLLAWLAALLLLGLARWLMWRRFHHSNGGLDHARRWMRRYALTSLLSGALMGSAGILFFDEQLLPLFALTVLLLIMSLGSIMVHTAYKPAHLAYVLPGLLPFALRGLNSTEPLPVMLGGMVLLLLPVNLYLYKKIRQDLLQSLQARFENQVLIEELTRQKELAEQAQARAEQANAAKTRFFAAASHDLRQPVQALELFAAALWAESHGRQSRHLVESVRSIGRELNDLLSALLDFSKIDSATIQPVVRDFPVTDLLSRIAADFIPLAESAGLRCRVRQSTAWVRSDPALLERIVRNFMSNAIKYTPRGRILLGCRRVAQGLRIEVHDTGIGIAAEQHDDVFRDFFQLDNPERDRHKGLGLGLAIVQGLARALGHPLSLRSRPGHGSVFAITLPLGESQPRWQTGSGVHPEPAALHDSASILLIDDDPTIRSAASNLLETWGYAVAAAESAAEALELLQATGFRPDVVLADLRLREGLSGVQAIQAVFAHCGRAIPAAIVTGDTDPSRLVEAKASGLPLVYKPLSAVKLRTLIGNLLRP
jgi:signal transduction histidine kinase/CheY-like chemotaxis protein